MYTVFVLATIDLRDPIWQFWVGVLSLFISAIAVIVTVVLAARSRQRKLLTYETISNTSVINVENDVGEDLEILVEKQPVTKVRLHVIRLLNAGNTPIEAEDYPQPLRFQFKDPFSPNPLIRCAISRTEPEGLIPEDHLRSLVSLDMVNQAFITLKTPLLNPREAIILRVLLTARDRHSTQMDVQGQVKGGKIKISTQSQKRVGWRTLAIATLIVGLVLGFLLNAIGIISNFAQNNCAFGSLRVDGSTSFFSTAALEATKYTSSCPIASINVQDSSSNDGMNSLAKGETQIANSELAAPANSSLLDHQVAVIVFALIINKQSLANITNLTTQQIQNIYDGKYTNWSQIDPQYNLPIKVIGRKAGSGTRAAFLSYVLKGSPSSASLDLDTSPEVLDAVNSTPGSIGYTDLGDAAGNSAVTMVDIDQSAPIAGLVENNAYPFWAVEHMYTQSSPSALTTSFIAYVTRDMQNNATFIRLDALGPGVLSSHT